MDTVKIRIGEWKFALRVYGHASLLSPAGGNFELDPVTLSFIVCAARKIVLIVSSAAVPSSSCKRHSLRISSLCYRQGETRSDIQEPCSVLHGWRRLPPLHHHPTVLGISHKSTPHLEHCRINTFDVGGIEDNRALCSQGALSCNVS